MNPTSVMRRTALVLAQALVVSVFGLAGVAGADGACAGPAAGGEWPVFGKEVFASRFQDAEHVIGPGNVGQLQPVWVLPADGTFESSPVVAGGCVYIGTQSGHVYALNADDGSLVWDAQLPSATTLSVGNGRVFVESNTILTAFEAQTGAQVWQKDFAPGAGYSTSGSPLAFETYVVAGLSGCIDFGARPTPCKGYYAILDQATGDLVVDGYDVSDEDVARGMEGSGFWSQPTYDPEDRYIYYGTANIRSINPENPFGNALLKIDADPNRATFGDIVGHFRDGTLNDYGNYPVLSTVCAGPFVISVACIDDDDWPSSAVIYRDSSGRKLLGSTHSNGAGLPTFASVVMPSGNYFAIDPDGMTEVWRAPTSGARAAVAAADASNIYYPGGALGELYAADKDTGLVLWKASVLGNNQWQHVAAANGVVYTPSGSASLADGGAAMLLAFDARDGTPLLQRPMAPDIGDFARGTVAGGITIARNTVYVPTNGAAAGYLVAYRLP
jgi:outer membrane protein assembly factor BamB